MAVPKYDELMKPLLAAVKDGEVYKIKDVTAVLAQQLIYQQKTSQKCFRAVGKPCLKTGSDGRRLI